MMTIWGERTAAVCCIAAAVYMAGEALMFPADGHLFPLFACAAIVVIASAMLLWTFIAPGGFQKEMHFRVSVATARPLLLTLATILYVLSMEAVGFYTVSLVYFILIARFVGVRNYLKIGLTALFVFPLMYVLFELILHTGMPKGILL